MGRRSEQRIVISFPVVVRGTDSRGIPFVVTTETQDVSCTGACLKGLRGIAEPGRKIEIECQTQKAWYRVQRAGPSGRTQEWRVGVRCLEPGKYIWGVPPKEWEPDTFDPAAANTQFLETGPAAVPAAAARPPRERRRFARHACRLEAQVITEGAYGEVAVNGKVTDISLGGCYVEMLSPFAVHTLIKLAFSTGEAPLHLSGRVCSSQEGFGMGVAFTGMGPNEFEQLLHFAPPNQEVRKNGPAKTGHSSLHAGARSEIPIAAASRMPSSGTNYQHDTASLSEPDHQIHSLPGAAELGLFDFPNPSTALESLVRLLLRKGILTQAELLQELERLKAAHT